MQKRNLKEGKQWMRLLAVLVTFILVVAPLTTGCGKSANPGTTKAPATTKKPATTGSASTGGATTTKATIPAGPRININRYGPSQDSLIVPVGTTVTFVNNDATSNHRVVADNGGFDTGVLGPGQHYSVHFGNRGDFTYRDRINPRIRGDIIVQ